MTTLGDKLYTCFIRTEILSLCRASTGTLLIQTTVHVCIITGTIICSLDKFGAYLECYRLCFAFVLGNSRQTLDTWSTKTQLTSGRLHGSLSSSRTTFRGKAINQVYFTFVFCPLLAQVMLIFFGSRDFCSSWTLLF